MARRGPPHRASKTPPEEPEPPADVPSLAGDVDELDGTDTEMQAAGSPPPSSKRDRPFFIVLAGSNVGDMYPLRHSVVIGRSAKAMIRIEDEGVSRRHARVTVADGEVHVEDLKSANGTFVNGEALSATRRRALKDGDKVTLGSTTILKFTYSDELEVVFQRRLLEAALRDGLTGAFNKRYMMDRLQTELAFALRHKTPLSLVMLDVDHFKRINDTFGHPAGDDVLVRLAKVVRATLRKEDVFARYGGEEFAVLCRSVDVRHAEVLAERLRQRIAAMRVEHEGERIPVTVSLGVAGFPESAGETPESLVAAADRALYEAKQSGRNRVVAKRRP